MLLKNQIDHVPGAQVTWWENQSKWAYILECYFFLFGQGMALAHDQCRFEIVDRVINHVVRYFDHGADGKVDLVSTE